MLVQKWCKCPQVHPRCCPSGWKLTLAGGRFTSPAESRYRPIEGECLSISEALQKAKYFVLGCPDLLVSTDHKPLVGLFDKPISDIQNLRLQAIAEKTLWYKFKVIHVPGDQNVGPDYFSRPGESEALNVSTHFSNFLKTEQISRADEVMEIGVIAAVVGSLDGNMGIKALSMSRVKLETNNDDTLSQLKKVILDDSQADSILKDDLSCYNRYRDRLYILDDCIMYDRRIVIPESLRPEVLNHLHAAHQGVEGRLPEQSKLFFGRAFIPTLRKSGPDVRNATFEHHRRPRYHHTQYLALNIHFSRLWLITVV